MGYFKVILRILLFLIVTVPFVLASQEGNTQTTCNPDGTDSTGRCNIDCGSSQACSGLNPLELIPYCNKGGNSAIHDRCSLNCQPEDRPDGICRSVGVSDCTGDAGCDTKKPGQCSTNNLKKCSFECKEISSCGDGGCNCGETESSCLGDCPLDYEKNVGIFYSIWHCPVVDKPMYNVENIKKGLQDWGPVGSYHYWAEPELGYYCLSEESDVLRSHALMLGDAGIDFIFVDATNHAYTDPEKSDLPQEMIIDPFKKLLEVWSAVENAPKIVIWAPLPSDGDMLNYLLSLQEEYQNTFFYYGGKPLILVVDRAGLDLSRLASLEQDYTVRKMWGLLGAESESWSFLECDPRHSVYNGVPEQTTICAAYQGNFMSNKQGFYTGANRYLMPSTPKKYGYTLRSQFWRALEHPSPILTVTSWNEWMAIRFCLNECGGETIQNCHLTQFEDGSKIFVDEYDWEYSRDIEPSKTEMGDLLYQIMKSCVRMYKSNQKCDGSHLDELCCAVDPPFDRCRYIKDSVIAGFEEGIDSRMKASCTDYSGTPPTINYAWTTPADATAITDDSNYWEIYDDGNGVDSYCDIHLEIFPEIWSNCESIKVKWWGTTSTGVDPRVDIYVHNEMEDSYIYLGYISAPNNAIAESYLALHNKSIGRVDRIQFRVNESYFSNLTNSKNKQRIYLLSVSTARESCTPKTCNELGYNCGIWSDGCGGTLNCGTCPTGQTCQNGVCTDTNTPSCGDGTCNGNETSQTCPQDCPPAPKTCSSCKDGTVCGEINSQNKECMCMDVDNDENPDACTLFMRGNETKQIYGLNDFIREIVARVRELVNSLE